MSSREEGEISLKAKRDFSLAFEKTGKSKIAFPPLRDKLFLAMTVKKQFEMIVLCHLERKDSEASRFIGRDLIGD
jgi:hypothetical protein